MGVTVHVEKRGGGCDCGEGYDYGQERGWV